MSPPDPPPKTLIPVSYPAYTPDLPDLPDLPDDPDLPERMQVYRVVEQVAHPIHRRRASFQSATPDSSSESFASSTLRLAPFFLMDSLPIVQLARDAI